jgi:hypothetical protein
MAIVCQRLQTFTLLMIVAVLIGSAIRNANAGDDESLSALAAQGASRRFDTEVGLIDAPGADGLSWQFQYTSVLRKKHQLTAVLPLIDPDVSGRIALRSGDLALGYSYSFKHEISANPWVPSNIGTGIGVSLPTGSFSDGTGTGSYVLAPRLGYVAKIGRSFALLPSLEYRRSFAAKDGATDFKAIAGTMPVYYVNPKAFWVSFSPIYLEDLSLRSGAFGYSLAVGKLFLKNLAVSLAYARLPEFEQNTNGENETIHQNALTVGFHLPFSYVE